MEDIGSGGDMEKCYIAWDETVTVFKTHRKVYQLHNGIIMNHIERVYEYNFLAE